MTALKISQTNELENASLHFKNNSTAVTGDILYGGSVDNCDILYGGSVDNWEETVKRIA